MSEVPLYCLGEGEYLVAGRVGRKRGLYVEGWIVPSIGWRQRTSALELKLKRFRLSRLEG